MDYGLSGKAAFVGGSSKGIGKAIAQALRQGGLPGDALLARRGAPAAGRAGDPRRARRRRGAVRRLRHVQRRRHQARHQGDGQALRAAGRAGEQRRRAAHRHLRRPGRALLAVRHRPEPAVRRALRPRGAAAPAQVRARPHHQRDVRGRQAADRRADPLERHAARPSSAWPRRSRENWRRTASP